MCQHCAKNSPTMIAGVNLSVYVKAEAAKLPWTFKLCPDLEAKLMMIVSTRLRNDAMKYFDPNQIDPHLMIKCLLEDLGLFFQYSKENHKVVYRGITAQAKGVLSDAIAWDAVFKVENGRDTNLFQWKVGFIFNDMATIKSAKKYIKAKRAEEDKIHQQRMSLAQSARARPPLVVNTSSIPSQRTIQAPTSAAQTQPATASQPGTTSQPATVRTQPAQGSGEGRDSTSASQAGTASNPISLDTDEDGGSSQYTHAHAPRVSSPLAYVSPYTAADRAAARAAATPRIAPEGSHNVPLANVTAPGNHRPAKRRSSTLSTGTARPPSRRRRSNAN
ncbi:hypothetical protein CEP54_015519 [Fusarium duplospermum]|uniref:Uncharacterized protein n=1 Tax=Fusarium duplospermum TaxID=1325734 RepID=A0A428NNJ7_9HYPO|nr:hypothetical protein CEP54_015519 [Fusarium duplospermum]